MSLCGDVQYTAAHCVFCLADFFSFLWRDKDMNQWPPMNVFYLQIISFPLMFYGRIIVSFLFYAWRVGGTAYLYFTHIRLLKELKILKVIFWLTIFAEDIYMLK